VLVEGRAFWPAGKPIALRATSFGVNYSVSPIDGIYASPLLGTASATLDVEVNVENKTEDDAPPRDVADRDQDEVDGEPGVHGGVGDEEEVRKPRVGRRPILPTKAEVLEHFPLHLQYRSWCRHCRAGKGRLAPHVVEPPDRERLGITFSADYAFMGAEEAEEEMQPSLIMYDDHKGRFLGGRSARQRC
jgi:hypothetical protein